MSEQVVRVVVADDQQVVREGLVALLGLIDGVEVVGAAADGAEAVQFVAEGNVDVVLMDLRMLSWTEFVPPPGSRLSIRRSPFWS